MINPPLGLLTVAALLPSAWELRLADLNTRKLTEQDWQWADLILISAMHIQRQAMVALVREAKARGKTVVVGGPHPTSSPEAALDAGCDFVVRGEGENTVPLLLEALRDGRTGVIEIEGRPDLTASPIPRFDLLRLADYDSMTVQTSRGCPFDCEFCDVVHLFGHKPRHKTPQQILAELESLYRLGALGHVLICDDNFIGSRKHARDLLTELIPWLQNRGDPFSFSIQASVNLGQDPEMLDLLAGANLEKVFIGIESPDLKVLETSRKFHNLKDPLLESLNNIRQHGIMVIGSFIIGLDGETPGAGQRICAFMEQAAIPMAMLGVLHIAPHTSLWRRLEKEGRLRRDVGHDGGTFSPLNFEPDRPEAEIFQEYVAAWDYLYEPSRYLARVYHYYLPMRPPRPALPAAAAAPLPEIDLPKRSGAWLRTLIDIRAFFRILWRQGILASTKRQFWTQLLGMVRHNPGRIVPYFVTCAMGEDLFHLRNVVHEKFTALAKERKIIDLPSPSPRGAREDHSAPQELTRKSHQSR